MGLLGINPGFIQKLFLALVALSVILAVLSRGLTIYSMINGLVFGGVVFLPVLFWDVVRVKRNALRRG